MLFWQLVQRIEPFRVVWIQLTDSNSTQKTFRTFPITSSLNQKTQIHFKIFDHVTYAAYSLTSSPVCERVSEVISIENKNKTFDVPSKLVNIHIDFKIVLSFVISLHRCSQERFPVKLA